MRGLHGKNENDESEAYLNDHQQSQDPVGMLGVATKDFTVRTSNGKLPVAVVRLGGKGGLDF